MDDKRRWETNRKGRPVVGATPLPWRRDENDNGSTPDQPRGQGRGSGSDRNESCEAETEREDESCLPRLRGDCVFKDKTVNL